LALRASLAERALLQGRFDAHPCLSKLKWPSLAISPWQNPLCSATLKGPEKSKETAKAKAKRKIWIPVSTGMTMSCSITAHIFFAFGFCC